MSKNKFESINRQNSQENYGYGSQSFNAYQF